MINMDATNCRDTGDREKMDQAIMAFYLKITKVKPYFSIQLMRNIKMELRFFIQCVIAHTLMLPEYLENAMVYIRYLKIGSDKNWKVGVTLLNVQIPWPHLGMSCIHYLRNVL